MTRSFLFFLVFSVSLVLVSGCASKKKIPDPQAARARRAAALKTHPAPPVSPDGGVKAEEPEGKSAIEETEINVDESFGPILPRQQLLMPTLTFINDRLFSYDKKVASWQELLTESEGMDLTEEERRNLEECLGKINSIRAGYKTFHDQLLTRDKLVAAKLITSPAFFDLQKKDIDFLDGPCPRIPFAIAEQKEAEPPPQVVELKESEAKIAELMDRKAYREVIELYRQLPITETVKPTFATTFNYALALLRSRNEKQALEVFKQLLGKTEAEKLAAREFNLMRMVADLELALQNYPGARKHYDKIITTYTELGKNVDWARRQLSMVAEGGTNVKERKAYAELLKNYLAYNPDRDGFLVAQQADRFLKEFAYSQVAASVEKLAKESWVRAKEWFSAFLSEVDDLVKAKKFQEALVKLESLPPDILPPEQREMLKTRVDEVTTAEAIEAETQIFLKEQNLQDNWNTAMLNLEARRYDEAIEYFQKLEGTTLEERARARIAEAINLAAQQDRRRAAELFVRAGRTQDPESKRKLLQASRRLLKDILVKYPQSDLVPKVTNNLKRIEEKMRSIDPTMLEEEATVGGTGAAAEKRPAAIEDR